MVSTLRTSRNVSPVYNQRRRSLTHIVIKVKSWYKIRELPIVNYKN